MSNTIKQQQVRDLNVIGISRSGDEYTVTFADGSTQTVSVAPPYPAQLNRVRTVSSANGHYTTIADAMADATFGTVIELSPGSFTGDFTYSQQNMFVKGHSSNPDSHGTEVFGVITSAQNRTRMKDLQIQNAMTVSAGDAHSFYNVTFASTLTLRSTSFATLSNCTFADDLVISADNTGIIYLIDCSFSDADSNIVNNSAAPVIMINCGTMPNSISGTTLYYGFNGNDIYVESLKTPITEYGTQNVVIVGADGKLVAMSASEFKHLSKPTVEFSSTALGSTAQSIPFRAGVVNKYSLVGTYGDSTQIGYEFTVFVDSSNNSVYDNLASVTGLGVDNNNSLSAAYNTGNLELTAGSDLAVDWKLTAE